MKIDCLCGKQFEGNKHRAYAFSQLPSKEQQWPFPAFSNILKEFTNYQIVKCPNCGNEYRDKSLKLFFFLSPTQMLVLMLFFNVAIIILFLFLFGVITIH